MIGPSVLTTKSTVSPPFVLTCIEAQRFISSCDQLISREFVIELPDFNTTNCNEVDCFALPDSEKILLARLEPTPNCGVYNLYLRVAKTFIFTIHCPTGDKQLQQVLTIPIFLQVSLPNPERVSFQVRITPIACKSYIAGAEPGITKFKGDQPGEQFGFAVAINDQPASLCVGSPSAAYNDLQDVGKVTVFSQITGDKLFQKYGLSADDEFGFALDAGLDLNGDGHSDILVGAPTATIGAARWAGYVRVISGGDGSTLLTIQNLEAEAQFGWAVSWSGDIDGDATPDIIVGAPQASPLGMINAGSVFVISGATGSLLYRLDGQTANDAFGYALKSIGDLDGDGIPDLAVGAPFASPAGIYQAGIIYVYSGASGSLLYTINGTETNGGLGFSLNSLADINNDGIPEILAGAPGSSPGGRQAAGAVYVFSGLDGTQLLTFAGPVSAEELGISVSPAGNYTHHDTAALVIGAPSASPGNQRFAGKVYIVATNGNVIDVLSGEKTWEQCGWSVCGLPNSTASYLLIGCPGSDLAEEVQRGIGRLVSEMKLDAVISVFQQAYIKLPAAVCNW